MFRDYVDLNCDQMPHKCRTTSEGIRDTQKVLPATMSQVSILKDLNRDLHKMGLKKTVSQSSFNRIYKSHKEVTIAKHGHFAKCAECEYYKEAKRSAANAEEEEKIKKEQAKHNNEQRSCRYAYYANRMLSFSEPGKYLSLIHDKMDHNKTSLPRLRPVTKDCSQIPQLPVSLFGILAHGHAPGALMHYFVQNWPGDPNLTISSISKCLLNMENQKRGSTSPDTITQDLHKALLDNKALDVHRARKLLDPQQAVTTEDDDLEQDFNQTSPSSRCSSLNEHSLLPPHLLLQLDNCASENKNRWLFGYLGLLVARGCFKSIRLSFLMVGHTHEDVDAIFSHISDTLQKQTCYTFPHMLHYLENFRKSGHDNHLLTEVADFKSFLKGYLLDGQESLTGHSKPLTFLFTLRDGVPVLRYKMRSYHKDWLPLEGIELFKRDNDTGNVLLPEGDPKPLPLKPLDQMVVDGLKRFVQHWKSGLEKVMDEKIPPVIEYWEKVIDAIQQPAKEEPCLRGGFWPSSAWKDNERPQHATPDLEEDADIVEQEHYVGPRNKKPFDVRSVKQGWYVLVRPSDDDFPVWLGRCLEDVKNGKVLVEWYQPCHQRGETDEESYARWWLRRWKPNPNDPAIPISIATIAHAWHRSTRCNLLTIPTNASKAAAQHLDLDVST